MITLFIINILFYSLANERTTNYLNNLSSVPRKVNYLFVGDSHGYEDINPLLLNNDCYNLSQPSDNFKDIYAKLLYLINLNTQINNLVIEIDPHLFANYRIYRNNNEMILNYLDFKNSKKIYKRI